MCKKIDELADTHDLESIMTVVKREVAIYKENKIKNMKTMKYDFNKQMPVSESTLIRKLYLKRTEVLENLEEPSIEEDTVIEENDDSNIMNDNLENYSMLHCELCFKIKIERFNYAIKCLELYIGDHPKDGKAKTLLAVAKPCMYVYDNNAKFEMAKLIRDFFTSKVTLNLYKYVYIWNDFEEVKV